MAQEYFKNLLKTIVQYTGVNTSNDQSFVNNTRAFQASVVASWNVVAYPLLSTLTSGPEYESDALDPLNGGIWGNTVLTDKFATKDGAPCLWNDTRGLPRTVLETIHCILGELAVLQNTNFDFEEFDNSENEAALACIKQNLVQVTKDAFSDDYTLDCDGNANLNYPLAQLIHAMGDFFSGFPPMGVGWATPDPVLNLTITTCQLTLDPLCLIPTVWTEGELFQVLTDAGSAFGVNRGDHFSIRAAPWGGSGSSPLKTDHFSSMPGVQISWGADLEQLSNVDPVMAGKVSGDVLLWDAGGYWTSGPNSDGDWIVDGSDMYAGVSGNIGVGAGHSAVSLPTQHFHIKDTGSPTLYIEGDNTGDPRLVLENDTGPVHFIFSDQSNGNALKIESGAGADLVFKTDQTSERMRILSTGNVGVNEVNPTTTLHIKGPEGAIRIQDGTEGVGKVLTDNGLGDGVGVWANPSAGSDGDWLISGSDMSSVPSGQVLIGTVVPANYKLHVETSLKGQWAGGFLHKGSGANLGNGVEINAGNSASETVLKLTNYDGSAEFLRCLGDGNVGINQSSPTHKLHISHDAAAFRLDDGSQVDTYVLTCDASGVGQWKPSAGGGGGAVGNQWEVQVSDGAGGHVTGSTIHAPAVQNDFTIDFTNPFGPEVSIGLPGTGSANTAKVGIGLATTPNVPLEVDAHSSWHITATAVSGLVNIGDSSALCIAFDKQSIQGTPGDAGGKGLDLYLQPLGSKVGIGIDPAAGGQARTLIDMQEHGGFDTARDSHSDNSGATWLTAGVGASAGLFNYATTKFRCMKVFFSWFDSSVGYPDEVMCTTYTLIHDGTNTWLTESGRVQNVGTLTVNPGVSAFIDTPGPTGVFQFKVFPSGNSVLGQQDVEWTAVCTAIQT
jgi:hypothetical protein